MRLCLFSSPFPPAPGEAGTRVLAPRVSASLSTKRRCFQNHPLQEGSPAPSSRRLLSSGVGSSTNETGDCFLPSADNSSNTRCTAGIEGIDKSPSSPAFAKSASPATHQSLRKGTRKGKASRGPVLRGSQPPQRLIVAATKDTASRAVDDSVLSALSSLYPRGAAMVPTDRGSKPRVKGATTRGGPNEVAVARASYSSPTESTPAGVLSSGWGGWVDR